MRADAAEFYSDHYGVPLSIAYERLRIQDAGQAVIDQVRTAVGPEWAGSWYDADDQGRLQIGVATSQDVPTGSNIDEARRVLEAKGVDGYSDFVPVQSSWNDLSAADATVNKSLMDLIATGQVTTKIDVVTNSVIVDAANNLPAVDASRVQVAARAVQDSVSVTVQKSVNTSLTDRFTSCQSRAGYFDAHELDCDPPLRGGIQIGVFRDNGDVSGCTPTLVVKSRSDSKRYLLTAGHCLYNDDGNIWGTRFSNGAVHDIGAKHSVHFPGTDYGLIDIDHPESDGWNVASASTSYLYVGPSVEGITTTNESYAITDVHANSEDMEVCMTSGTQVSTTGHHTDCGIVFGLGKAASDDQGHVVIGLAEASLCVTTGSSGGPVYKNHIGYGLLSATALPSSNCDTVYQGLAGALEGSNVGLL